MDKELDKELTDHGFDITGLTTNQKWLIVEPSWAPENFACDGELPIRQRKPHWINKMERAGLSQSLIKQAVKTYLG